MLSIVIIIKPIPDVLAQGQLSTSVKNTSVKYIGQINERGIVQWFLKSYMISRISKLTSTMIQLDQTLNLTDVGHSISFSIK